MRPCIVTAFLMVGQLTFGQVHVDRSVQLISDDEALRQITGLRDATRPDEVSNVATVRMGLFAVAELLDTNWSVTMPALDGPPATGSSLHVLFPDTIPGNLTLVLNGSGPYSILVDNATLLDGASFDPGTILSLVFNGTAFQSMNHRRPRPTDCPDGMVAVNDGFCIDVQLAPEPLDFFEAADHCGARGARLCSWAEFMSSCVERIELGLAMVGNYEWVGSACNENGLARISGLSGCTSTACAFATGDQDRRFRCCQER